VRIHVVAMSTAGPPVRFGCAQGKDRALTLGQLLEDWVSRTICPTWHINIGLLEQLPEAAQALDAGFAWIEDHTKTLCLVFIVLAVAFRLCRLPSVVPCAMPSTDGQAMPRGSQTD
jgi:hypothetical protein